MIRWRYLLVLVVTLPAAPLGWISKVYFAAFMTGWNAAGRRVGRFLKGVSE